MSVTSNSAPLAGQVAVVTGAAHGIGYAIAQRLAELGADLMLADLSSDQLLTAVTKLRRDYSVRIESYVGDLSEQSVVQALREQTQASLGSAQILINCAGGGVILPFLEHTADTLKATMDRNIWTALWCCHEFLPDMVNQSYGRIINLGADSVRNGLVDHAAYNAAKGGLHGLTSGLAREFALSKITVNTVAPCAVATPQLVHFIETKPDLAQRFIDMIPMGRPGEVEEVASMVGYLALPEAAFVTGQVISVNGGSTML